MTFLIYLCLLKLLGDLNLPMILLGIAAWIGHIVFVAINSNVYDLQIKTLINQLARLEDKVVKMCDKE